MTTNPPTVRVATAEDRLAVARIVDAAALEVEGLVDHLDAGDVLVAVEQRPEVRGERESSPEVRGERESSPEAGEAVDSRERVLGAVVLEPRERGARVAAIAVRRRLRDRGVGTALIEAAREREGRLVAEFDPSVRPFYDSLGFSIERLRNGRRRGVREATPSNGDSSS